MPNAKYCTALVQCDTLIEINMPVHGVEDGAGRQVHDTLFRAKPPQLAILH